MDKQPTIFGLSLHKIAELWNIGSDTVQAEKTVDEDSKKTELLRDRLAETLPVGLSKRRAQLEQQTNLQSAINSVLSKSIESILQNPETDIALFRNVKNYGKKLSESAKSQTDYRVANTVYYAAIASALVFQDRKITKFSYKDMEKYFSRLSQENWIPKNLRNLFRKAYEYCVMRQGGS